MTTELRYSTVRSCARLLANGSVYGDFEAVGVTPDDLALVTGDRLWIASERNRVTRILDNCLYSTMDAVGIPRFEAPAEFIAAVVAVFVDPVNYMLASRFMETGRVADDIIDSDSPSLEPVTADKVFALLCRFYDSEDIEDLRDQFEKRVGWAIWYAEHRDADPDTATKRKKTSRK